MEHKNFGHLDGQQIVDSMVKELAKVKAELREEGQEAGEAVGIGWDDGLDYTVEKIKASSIKMEKAFSNLSEKIRKQVQQLTTKVNGKDFKLKIDFSDININSDDIKNKVARIVKDISAEGLIEFDTKGSEQQFKNLITLYVKYQEKLNNLQRVAPNLTSSKDIELNLRQQLMLALKLKEIYSFLDSPGSIKGYSMEIKKMADQLVTVQKVVKQTSGGDANVAGDYKELAEILKEIQGSLKVISDTFANENNSMKAMAENGKTSFESLSQAIIEVYNNLTNVQSLVDTISKKDFNVTNITQTGGGSSNLQAMTQQMTVARETMEHLRSLYDQAGETLQGLGSKGQIGLVVEYSKQLQELNLTDIGKSVKGANTEMKLASVLAEMQDYIDKLIQINELRNKYGLGEWKDTFVSTQKTVVKPIAQSKPQVTEVPMATQPQNIAGTSNAEAQQMWQLKAAIDEVTNAIGRKNAGFVKEKEIVDQSVNAEEAKLRELVGVITTEIGNALDSIKEKFAQSFVIPELDKGNLQASLGEIYNEFVKLQENIGRLQFGITPQVNTNIEEAPKQSPYHAMSREDATGYIAQNYDYAVWDDWYSKALDTARTKIAETLESDMELRNAALNQMYDEYKRIYKSNISFEEFLNTEIPLYRGKRPEDESIHEKAMSFTLDSETAKGFGDFVLKTMMRPIDTLGMSNPTYTPQPEAEVLVLNDNIVKTQEYIEWENKLATAKQASIEASRKEVETVEQVEAKPNSITDSAFNTQQTVDGEGQEAADVAKQFVEAANAKKQFVEANKQVAESAKSSESAIKKEAEAAKTVATDVGNVAKDLAKTKNIFNDAGELIQTDTTRKFTTDKAVVTETDSTRIMRDDDGNETTSTITTIVNDFEKLTKETKKSEEAVARAQKKLDEFLARFQSKSGGNAKFINGFSDLEGTKVTSDNMEDIFNKMMALQEEYSKLETNFRKGQSSLNPFVNAITKSENIGNIFGDVERQFNGLTNKSDELVNNFTKLQKLAKKIQEFTRLMNSNPDTITPKAFSKFSKQVGEFNVLKSQVEGSIKAEQEIETDNEKQRKKEVQDYIDLVKQMYEYEAKAAKGGSMQSIYETKVAKLKDEIIANDKLSIMNQEEKNKLLAIEEAHQLKISEIKQKDVDKQFFKTQNDKLQGKYDAGYLSEANFSSWQNELATYQSYLDGTVVADEATIQRKKASLTQLYDHLNKISNASRTFFASGGEILPTWFSPEQIQNTSSSLRGLYDAIVTERFDGMKTSVTGVNATLGRLTFTVDNGKGSLAQYTIAMDKASGATKLLSGNTKETLATVQQFGKALKGDAKHLFSAFIGGMSGMYAVGRYFKEGIQYVRELDKALTELKKVTDETEETYDRFLETAGKTSTRIGSTLSQMTNATAEFAKLGYDIQMASSMAESALVYTNVGDNVDVETGSQSIISTMKAFGIEANNTMSIVDKFNEIGNNFAITTKGIGDALQVSASAMAAAGNTLDETIALTTAANTIVQNPNTVGRNAVPTLKWLKTRKLLRRTISWVRFVIKLHIPVTTKVIWVTISRMPQSYYMRNEWSGL